MKLVSVVVATYKREEALKRALDSLAAQSYPALEIILVDDNADMQRNEKVSAIVQSFRQRFPAIPMQYIVNTTNQGSAKTRNIGIAAANGEYVTFLDDDDVYLPEKIKKQVTYMENGGFDYSITDLLLYNKEDRLIDRRIRSYIKDTSVEGLRRYHLKYHMTGTDTLMFRKAYINQIDGFAPIDVGDEFYLMMRAIEGGGKFGYLPGCEVKAYVHTGDGGLSSGDQKIIGENALYAYKKTQFAGLTAKDIRYIKMRHYAVIAYAELRRKKYWKFARNAAQSVVAAPLQFVAMYKQPDAIM